MYTHSSYSVTLLSSSATLNVSGALEFLMCELKRPGTPPIFVAVIYRPPPVAFTTPVDLGQMLSTAMSKYAHKVIMGDFNADQLGTSHDVIYIRSLMSDLSLKLVDHGVTHVTGSSETWRDLCLVDKFDIIISWNKSPTPLGAGHHLISVVLDVEGVGPKAKVITTR